MLGVLADRSKDRKSSAARLNKVSTNLFPSNAITKKPFVIITVGPTGSGKTGLVKKTIEYCNLPSSPTPRVYLVDDLVVVNPEYKKRVKAIIDGFKITVDNVEEFMENPEVIKAFNEAYFGVRNGKDKQDEPHKINCVEGVERNCNIVNDDEMRKAIASNESFVLEITGRDFPKWFLETGKGWLGEVTEKYDVYVTGVFVYDLDELIKRNKDRFKRSFELFLSDPANNPGPRLPDIRKDNFNASIITIRNTIRDMYKTCVLPKDKDITKCGNENIDRLLLYKNNEDMQLVFDSLNPSTDFDTVIEGLYKEVPTSGGRKRKTCNIKRKHKFRKGNSTNKTKKKSRKSRKHRN